MTPAPARKNLPEGWRWVRLGQYVTKIGSGLTPLGGQAAYRQSGVPLIRSQNVHLNRFVPDGLVYISKEQDAGMAGSRVQPGDVLLNITGASIGRVCVVPPDLCPANVNQHVSIIRPSPGLDSDFLSYFISTPAFQTFIADSQAGATRQALTKGLIETFNIPLPPLAEQKRIAAVLADELAAIDRARAAAEARLEAAKALPAAYLRAVFGSPEAQQGWRWVRLAEVIREAQGGFASGERDPKGVVQLRMNNVTNRGGFDWGSVVRVPADRDTIETYRLLEKDVVFNNTNSTELVGKTALFEGYCEPVLFSNHFTRLRTIPELLTPPFLAFWLQERWQYRVFADICNRWIGQSAVQRDKLLALDMPLPPLGKQKRIAGVLSEKVAAVERARAAAEAQLAEINALPAALLRRAFSGEL